MLHLYLQPNSFINKPNQKLRRDIFQAIADPTRRAIIALIALQAMTPNAIAENFHASRQAVSKHLRILTECEMVKQEQQGREIYYSLKIEKLKDDIKVLNQKINILQDQDPKVNPEKINDEILAQEEFLNEWKTKWENRKTRFVNKHIKRQKKG